MNKNADNIKMNQYIITDMICNDIHPCLCTSRFDWNIVLVLLSASKKETSWEGTMKKNSLAVIGKRGKGSGAVGERMGVRLGCLV